MSVLVTGGGMIGSQVVARLVEMKESVVLYELKPRLDFLGTIFDLDQVKVVTGDILDMELLTRVVENEKVDRIIHTAALFRSAMTPRPHTGIATNYMGTVAVLEVARNTGIKRVVFSSSGTVNFSAYGVPEGGVINEDFTMRVLSSRPKDLYALTKLMGEHTGLLYNDAYGVDFAAVRLGGGFGPALGEPSGAHAKVLIKLVWDAALGKPVVIDDPAYTYAGLGEVMYVKDQAKALVLAAFAEKLQKRVYNVRMGKTYLYHEIVETVRKVFPEVTIEVKAEPRAGAGDLPTRKYPRDISSARKELGFAEDYDLESGIRDWAAWIRAHGAAFA